MSALKYVFAGVVAFDIGLVTPCAAAGVDELIRAGATTVLTARVALDLPAQPMDRALAELSKRTGLGMIFSTEDVARELQAPAIRGTYAAEEALRQLLADSGLKYEFVNARTVAIRPAKSVSAAGSGTSSVSIATDRASSAAANVRLAQVVQNLAGNAAQKAQTDPSSRQEEPEQSVQEVVVTAQRREERLIDTPISIGVLSGQDLNRSSSRSVADVLNQLGGAALNEIAPGKSQIIIRGAAPALVGTSTAAYYLDEVPFAFISTAELPQANAYDLARVEVLRGPQGTLYGANALSGVVRVITNDANLEQFQASSRARTSSTEEGGENYGGDLALNVPLVPGVLAVRGVASYSDLSGYIDSTGAARGTPPATDINDSIERDYRLRVGFQPNNEFRFRFGWARSEIDNDAPSQAQDEEFNTPFSTNQADHRLYDTYNLITEYHWSSVSFLSSTSYFDYFADTQFENTPIQNTTFNYFVHRGLESFAQEFRLLSDSSRNWRWSAGAIYKHTEEEAYTFVPAFVMPSDLHYESESYAVFGELTHSFADDRFEITAGVRYYADALVSTQLSSFGIGTAGYRQIPDNFEKVTGRVVLTYKPDVDHMLYAAVGTGFRSGLVSGFNAAALGFQFPPLAPDSLLTYEVGAKGTALDHRFTYDTTVYFSDWQDIQQSLIIPGGFSAGVNAGAASGFGVDASLSFELVENLQFRGSVGWNGLELDENVFSAGVPLFLADDRVNLSPEWTGSVGASYLAPDAVADLDIRFETSLGNRSASPMRFLQGSTVFQTQSDSVKNLGASIALEGNQWALSFFGDNLLDDRGRSTPPDPLYGLNSVRLRPRTIGLQVNFNY